MMVERHCFNSPRNLSPQIIVSLKTPLTEGITGGVAVRVKPADTFQQAAHQYQQVTSQPAHPS